jgi:uncharacterized membrane protein
MLRVYFETTADGTPLFVEAGMWIDLAADPIADAVTERCFGFVHGALCRSAVTSERTARA